jgi:AraC family transcriptional regulator, ethanolamine operon transcriptional activator
MHCHQRSMRLESPDAAAPLQGAVVAATAPAEGLPDAADAPGLLAALSNGGRQITTDARSRAGPPRPFRRGARDGGARDESRLVAAAEEFLRAHLSLPIYTEELCAALDVSPRRLHHAFAVACGTSPQAHLKLRRLMLVRRALASGGAGVRLVKSVALAHGFWHLGNFARDYRERFGESPSETLARARPSRGARRLLDLRTAALDRAVMPS